MAYKAFLIGANTLGLQYAERDTLLMQEALQLYGYEVVRAPTTKSDLLIQLEEMLDNNCHKTDTILFYFSGHGVPLKGKLHLVLGEDTSKQAHVLNISDVTSRLENSKANNKLIILDCCKANTVQADWQPDFTEFFRVLTASERLEQAKEIDSLQASFLTYYLHQALTTRYAEIADTERKIYINKLFDWLFKTTQQYNATATAPVPLPNLLGNQKANFELAEVPIEKLVPMVTKPSAEQLMRFTKIKEGLKEKRANISSVFPKILKYIRELEKRAHLTEEMEENLLVVEDFLTEQVATEDFIEFWQQPPTKPEETLNYRALFKNLQSGKIVVFLNNSISPKEILTKLREDAQLGTILDVNPCHTFAEVCEYLEMSEVGRSLLCDELGKCFQSTVTLQAFYELLAQISRPVVIISTDYDSVLDEIFRKHDKKFALISHPIRFSRAGTIIVEYSDSRGSEEFSMEDLSKVALLEKGYSLIYKIRGYFPKMDCPEIQERLILSERDYFLFSRYSDRLIPNYLASLLSKRGFWFVGNPPQNWEERLLVQAILEKRRQFTQQSSFEEDSLKTLAFAEKAGQFASVYWKAKHFDHHPVDLNELVDKLREQAKL